MDARDVAGGAGAPRPAGHLANVAGRAGRRRGGRHRDRSACCPTTTSSTSCATSSPAPAPRRSSTSPGSPSACVICEDVWTGARPGGRAGRPGRDAARGRQRVALRARAPRASARSCCAARAVETGCPIAYVNLVGGQDELVFDGQSVVVDARARSSRAPRRSARSCWSSRSRPRAATPAWRSTTLRARPTARTPASVNHVAEPLAEVEEVYEALVAGTRDYLRKNGFRSAVLGALGRRRLVARRDDRGGRRGRGARCAGLAMPSRYSSPGSVDDAVELAAPPRHRGDDGADRVGPRGPGGVARRARWAASPPG